MNCGKICAITTNYMFKPFIELSIFRPDTIQFTPKNKHTLIANRAQSTISRDSEPNIIIEPPPIHMNDQTNYQTNDRTNERTNEQTNERSNEQFEPSVVLLAISSETDSFYVSDSAIPNSDEFAPSMEPVFKPMEKPSFDTPLFNQIINSSQHKIIDSINTIIGINAADTNNDPNEAVILSESEIESIIKITNRRRSINIPNIPIHVDLTKQKHIDFVYDYIRSLIRYIRTTTAIHYVPSNIKPPNTSHRSVQYIGKLISKLAALTDKQIGVQNRMKIRLYRKLLNPLVIAVRHREDLIQLRTAHSDVTTKYGKLVSSMNRKATVGIDLGLPEIKRDILMYIERYGMPEEFIFETDRLRDIRRELNSSASVVPRSG